MCVECLYCIVCVNTVGYWKERENNRLERLRELKCAKNLMKF